MPVIFGDNERINCGNDGSLGSTGLFTIAIYAKPNATSTGRGLFSRIQFSNPFPGYALCVSSIDKMQAYIGGWVVGNAITEGIWSWFFYIRDAVNLNFYQDLVGKGVAACSVPGACVEPANIGGWGDDTFNMDGLIGEVYVWDGVNLSASERGLIVNSKIKGIGLQIQPAALKGYWSLDDHPDGTNLVNEVFTDKSGNGNNGTTNGGIMNAEEVLSYQ